MSKITYSTPLNSGFRMVAEWEGSSKIWILWPERPDNWRDNAIPAQYIFAEIANKLSKYRQIIMGVSREQINNANKLLSSSVNIEILEYDDAWIRDTGPTFVVNDAGLVRGVSWGFNAWGGAGEGLYDSWEKDKKVAKTILETENMDFYEAPIILEGGSIHVDGRGTLITTKECLLNKNRNPQFSKKEVEETLKKYCGVKKIIWLEYGFYNDETNGHIDNIFSFVKPGVGLINWTDDRNDPNYSISRQMMAVLEKERDAEGRYLEIIKIIQPTINLISESDSSGVIKNPGTYPRNEGDRLTASYINYYRDKDFILLPFFGNKIEDLTAYNLFSKIFPGSTIIPVYSREIILGGGGIHCITLNQP